MEEGEQKLVVPLKPLFRMHTLIFLPTFYWSKQVTWPSSKSMDEDAYSTHWKAQKKVWVNNFITGRERIVGNNLIYHNVSRRIVLIDLMRQDGALIRVRLSRAFSKTIWKYRRSLSWFGEQPQAGSTR